MFRAIHVWCLRVCCFDCSVFGVGFGRGEINVAIQNVCMPWHDCVSMCDVVWDRFLPCDAARADGTGGRRWRTARAVGSSGLRAQTKEEKQFKFGGDVQTQIWVNACWGIWWVSYSLCTFGPRLGHNGLPQTDCA